jgi:O-antigen ligase
LKVDLPALALTVVLFAEQLLFGANSPRLSLAFAALHFGLLLTLIAASRGQEPPRLPLTWPAALIAVVFAIGLISILPLGPPLAHPFWSYLRPIAPDIRGSISLEPFATRVEMVKLAGFLALFLYTAAIGGRREGSEALARYLCVAGILYSVWAGFAYATNPHAIFGAPRPYGGDRLGASYFSANSAGTFFACLTILGLAGVLRPLLREERPGGRQQRSAEFLKTWPQALLTLLAMTCLLLSASRGGLLALAAAILFCLGLAIWAKGSRQSLTAGFLSVLCLVLMAVVVIFVFGGDRTAERFAQVDPLTEDRLKMFAGYWPTFLASPWLGYGLGAFQSFNGLSMTAQNALALASLGAAHNVYLQWLLQEGIPGALAMFGAVGLVLLATAKGLRRRATQRWLGVACLGVAVVFAVHGLVDYALEEPSLAAFFSVMLGLGYGLAERPASGRRR